MTGQFEVPERESVLAVLKRHGQPMALEQLADAFGAHGGRERKQFARFLRAMQRDGQLLRNRASEYGLVERMDLVRGRVIGHRDGFGFLAREEAGEDLFLSPRQMRSLMHGDRIVARVSGYDRRGRAEAAVVEVLERAVSELVGRLVEEGGAWFVIPDQSRIRHDVLIAAADVGDARDGDMVVVTLLAYPDKRQRALGRVKEVLGAHMDPGLEIEVAIRAHGLPVDFTAEALSQAETLGERVRPRDRRGREDLRELPLVTIDGADARDFDDAVHCRRTATGWKLIVAIADVAAYVPAGSALDEDARERGNSVYFPDRVLPMLPESLSNGLCSLKPEVDRLCMVCEMLIDRGGELKRSRFLQGLMRSQARLTYDEMAQIVVQRDAAARQRRGELVPHLDELYRLFKAMLKARDRRGALELDTVETRVVLDAMGKVERVAAVQRNDAHRIIEECMVAANVAAARFVVRHRIPSLFRVHEGARSDGLFALREYLAGLGLTIGGGERPDPDHYRALLKKTAARPDSASIQTMVLRSLSQAVYSPDNQGHFGLALPAYAHFTSPIRRYADLVLHRAIKRVLDGPRRSPYRYTHAGLAAVGEHISMTERRADDATRDAIAWLKCEYMSGRVGQVFQGTVTGVAGFGLFMMLDELNVEGLVHVSALGRDYYHFDPQAQRLQGESSGERFAVGDGMSVRVLRVNLDERKVDFERVVSAGELGRDRARGGRDRRGQPAARRGRRRR
jgi:ribonuclease R